MFVVHRTLLVLALLEDSEHYQQVLCAVFDYI